ncbi:hypothetical protein ACFQ22_01335 [Lentilactobacillus raoultii]|uniref:DUF5590 domain-containing protein n=1 Tax=Lentilactobacillus raoultii TaxID=1987503 RepID=A0ABW3PKU1_9LACO|nr:hypothetical protein [Lentilactobacillus raoultii]
MEQPVTLMPRHWKFSIFVIVCLIFSLTASTYLLIHNRSPQIAMDQLAQQHSHQMIDKKSVVALSADNRGDQVVLGFTKRNQLIVQFRERILGGYAPQGYHVTQMTAQNLNHPYQLKNIVAHKYINNFTYGFLKNGQRAPKIKGNRTSLITHHGQRIFYSFTKPNEKVAVQFNS